MTLFSSETFSGSDGKVSALLFRNTFGHANGTGGTDKAAEVAAYTLCADNARLARLSVKVDSLMAAVHTRGLAASATYAAFAVNHGIDNGIAVQVGGQVELWQQFANQIGYLCNTPFCHIILKS